MPDNLEHRGAHTVAFRWTRPEAHGDGPIFSLRCPTCGRWTPRDKAEFLYNGACRGWCSRCKRVRLTFLHWISDVASTEREEGADDAGGKA